MILEAGVVHDAKVTPKFKKGDLIAITLAYLLYGKLAGDIRDRLDIYVVKQVIPEEKRYLLELMNLGRANTIDVEFKDIESQMMLFGSEVI